MRNSRIHCDALSWRRGEPKTPFMAFGDTVRMEVFLDDGSPLFGAIDQRVVRAG